MRNPKEGEKVYYFQCDSGVIKLKRMKIDQIVHYKFINISALRGTNGDEVRTSKAFRRLRSAKSYLAKVSDRIEKRSKDEI